MLKIVHSTVNKPTRKQEVRALCEQFKRNHTKKMERKEKIVNTLNKQS